MKNRFNKNERGFALPLVLLLLVVMTIMGTTLITITSGEHKANTNKDISQQTFYAAESGITIAKTWIVETSSSKTLSPGGSPGITFCKTNFFPNLNQGSIKAINNPATNRAYVGRNTLNSVITGISSDEQNRLAKYSYEFFITYTPDPNGNTDPNGNPLVPRTKQVAGTVGSSIAESASYKTGGTSMATYYTIFSCGKGENDTIVPLEAVVTLTK